MRTASELVPYFSRLLDDEPELPLDDEDDELLEEDDEPLTASAILASVFAPQCRRRKGRFCAENS